MAIMTHAKFHFNLGIRPLVTLIEESPWEVDPGGIPREAISSFSLK